MRIRERVPLLWRLRLKLGSPLKTYARLERRTPLRASKFSNAEGRGGRLGRAAAPMTPVREGAPVRRRGTVAVVEAAASASPSSLALKVGGHYGPRNSKRSYVGLAADTQPLVALEGQLQTVGFMFAKPAPRMKAASAPLRRSRMKVKAPRRLDGPGSDPGRLEWCRHQVCVGVIAFPDHMCRGPVDPSHLRNHTGAGLKEPDSKTCPKCRDLHMQWEERRGYFAGWSNERWLAWILLRIAETEAEWLGLSQAERERWQERAKDRRRAAA